MELYQKYYSSIFIKFITVILNQRSEAEMMKNLYCINVFSNVAAWILHFVLNDFFTFSVIYLLMIQTQF